MPRSQPHLSFKLGFSRYFTAELVALWRHHVVPIDRPVTADDLLDPATPTLWYAAVRAAGAEGRTYDRTPRRRRARVEKLLSHFADAQRPLPTHDGADDAYLVRTTVLDAETQDHDAVPAYVLVRSLEVPIAA